MSRSRNVANRTQTGSPHIITTKLYPAYLGKLLDGTTSHSGAYGTEQSDGRMYYYTDIAGSKPIHDPRIGAHFGSQRHTLKSIQVLHEETSLNGVKVYSVDGREWMRAKGTGVSAVNGSSGTNIAFTKNTGSFVEVVGYFNDAIVGIMTDVGERDITYKLNGGTESSVLGSTAVDGPNRQRYVDATTQVHLNLGATLGINTVRIGNPSATRNDDPYIYNIELIVQDTTDNSSRSKIQIPKQSVYTGNGKHEVPAQAVHYDPFNGMTTASGFGGYVDEKSSLGLEKWKVGSTCYRPYNGARVIKWVDVDGAIKTSVTCVPPNAKSIADSSSLTNGVAKSDASASNDTFYPTFEAHNTSVNEDELHELAKSFHIREFGNGSANGNGGLCRDLTILDSQAEAAYVMDDGLTSVGSSENRYSSVDEGLHRNTSSAKFYHTFIGTGIGRNASNSSGVIETWAQNLPYGTHILSHIMDGTDTSDWYLDGVRIYDNSGGSNVYHNIGTELHIYQPKRPLIPEDACVLADYMLMADFKQVTSPGNEIISKGVRRCDSSRDVYYNNASGNTPQYQHLTSSTDIKQSVGNMRVYIGASHADAEARLTAFCTNMVHYGWQVSTRYQTYEVDTGSGYSAQTVTKNGTGGASYYDNSANSHNLGIASHRTKGTFASSSGYCEAVDVVTPIHTSHHYQFCESPLLNELLGGDRSIEQTNLICNSEGNSWDQITRDTSYISNFCLTVRESTGGWVYSNTFWKFNELRGKRNDLPLGSKYWAWAYDKWICLEDGMYTWSSPHLKSGGDGHNYIYINGNAIQGYHEAGTNYTPTTYLPSYLFKRGDYVQFYDRTHGQMWSSWHCEKG